jgi:hypothetical protein
MTQVFTNYGNASRSYPRWIYVCNLRNSYIGFYQKWLAHAILDRVCHKLTTYNLSKRIFLLHFCILMMRQIFILIIYKPTYPFGSRPSILYLSLKYMEIRKASSGEAVHSRIFLAQYIRRKPCIFPSWRNCRCAAFHKLSWVLASSSCVSL